MNARFAAFVALVPFIVVSNAIPGAGFLLGLPFMVAMTIAAGKRYVALTSALMIALQPNSVGFVYSAALVRLNSQVLAVGVTIGGFALGVLYVVILAALYVRFPLFAGRRSKYVMNALRIIRRRYR